MKQRAFEIGFWVALVTLELAWLGLLGWGMARLVDWI